MTLVSLFSRFHTSRYPTIPSDIARKFDPATHNHVVFIRNNRFFEVQLARLDGTELSVADLEMYALVDSREIRLITTLNSPVPSPMSSTKQIPIKELRSAPSRARIEIPGHMYVFTLGRSHPAKTLNVAAGAPTAD